ncbi:MerR family transcriptional regulator [Sinomicrobium pectinilyticum]|uniref:MerR family transcriptional regulator n=1 Tax=Sinomicrobium pectinilyticum TaxID=1084421 RepID=A0A3N0EGZ0_SINP1|nr:chaperone modulator CbpM [Sinomicrobium pectinilyticum]RNL87061.1 MerR family transcriptional regulator [Sinomicrobium pectinilyticum]
MSQEELISITTFCTSHKIEVTFIRQLAAFDLVEIVNRDKEEFLYSNHLPHVEKLMRLHYDLQINMEGLNAVHHLLQRIDELQNEVIRLRNKRG